MVSEFRANDYDGEDTMMPILDNSTVANHKPASVVGDNINNFGPAIYKPSHNRAHDVVQYESQRWPGHVLEFSVSKRSKTNPGTVYYRCIQCNQLAKKGSGSYSSMTVKNDIILTDPDYPKVPHICRPGSMVTETAAVVSKRCMYETSSRDSKKRGSARSTAGSTADDHQLQIINQVIANSKYGRYDDEDAEVDDNDVIAKLREWGQNGFDQHLFAQSHAGMSRRNASGASIENRRRALSINCNLELNSPINKPFEDNTNIDFPTPPLSQSTTSVSSASRRKRKSSNCYKIAQTTTTSTHSSDSFASALNSGKFDTYWQPPPMQSTNSSSRSRKRRRNSTKPSAPVVETGDDWNDIFGSGDGESNFADDSTKLQARQFGVCMLLQTMLTPHGHTLLDANAKLRKSMCEFEDYLGRCTATATPIAQSLYDAYLCRISAAVIGTTH